MRISDHRARSEVDFIELWLIRNLRATVLVSGEEFWLLNGIGGFRGKREIFHVTFDLSEKSAMFNIK